MRRDQPAKGCPVCAHAERRLVELSLALGQAPRSIAHRDSDLSRARIARHRDECLTDQKGERE